MINKVLLEAPRALVAWAVLLCLLAGVVNAAPASAEKSAHAVVEETTEELMEVVRNGSQLLEKDPGAYFERVNNVLDPVVDFNYIARGVMGRYWQDASEEQRRRFVEVFRNSLVETYAKGMANYADLKTRIVAPAGENKDKHKASVIQEITGPDGTNRVAYTMLRNRSGEWKLVNMVLNGVNLGTTFRNQFAQAAKQHDGDLDAVIRNWSAEA